MTDQKVSVEYVFSERGLAAVTKAIEDIRDGLRDGNDASSAFSKELGALERELKKVADSAREVGSANSSLSKGTSKQSKEFTELAAALKSANEEYRKLAQQSVVDGGNASDALGSFDSSDIERYRQTRAAATADIIADDNKRIASERKAADESRKALEASGVAIDGLSKRTDKAVQSVDKFNDARARSAKRSENKDALKAWDDEFKALEKATAAQQRHGQAATGNTQSINSQRYALYDLATSYAAISTALLGTSALVLKTAADFESAFTNVERTLSSDVTANQISRIREELVALSLQMPRTFAEISAVATLGNQLGVAADDLEAFTQTAIRFSAVSGISVDETALAFGQIGELLNVSAAEYENLGSSIALVGVNSVATEAQILSVAREISATAAQAGFAAEEVIGLSGALASLRIAPERARGALDTYFATLNRAVANGGEDLENFAQVVGVTSAELDRLVRAGEGERIFRGFLEGLADLDNVDTTRALDELNLAQLRVSNSLIRLGDNLSVYDSALADARQGMAEGSELSRQFGLVVDDVSSKFQIFQNNVAALSDAIGAKFLPMVGTLLDALSSIVFAFNSLASLPVVGDIFTGLAAGAVLAVGALAALRGAQAATRASLLAYVTATGAMTSAEATNLTTKQLLIRALGGVTATANSATLSFGRYTASLGAVAGSSRIGAAAVTALGRAINFLSMAMRAVPFIAVLSLFTQSAANAESYRQNVAALATEFRGLGADGADAVQQINALLENGLSVSGGLFGLTDLSASAKEIRETLAIFSDAGVAGDAFGFFNDMVTGLKNITGSAIDLRNDGTKALEQIADALNDLAEDDLIAAHDAFLALAASLGVTEDALASILARFGYSPGPSAVAARSIQQIGNSAVSTAGALDLLSRTFSFVQAGMARGAADRVSALRKQIDGLGKSSGGASRQVRTLVDYANDLASVFSRSFDIRFGAQLDLDKVTTSWRNLADSIEEARINLMALTAQQNINQHFLSVAEMYGDALRADALRAEIADVNRQIADEQENASTALAGNSRAAIRNRKVLTDLIADYQDYIQSLAASGASQSAIRQAIAQSRQAFITQATDLGYNTTQVEKYALSFNDMATAVARVPRNVTVAANVDPALQAFNELVARGSSAGRSAGSGFRAQLLKELEEAERQVKRLKFELNFEPKLAGALTAGIGRMVFSPIRGFADGGYTGRGGKYTPAGVVHAGEYVIPKQYVNQRTGLPDMNYVSSLQRGRPTSSPRGNGYANGGLVSGGQMVGIIDAGQMNELVTALAGLTVEMDGRVVGQLVNKGNYSSVRLGVG